MPPITGINRLPANEPPVTWNDDVSTSTEAGDIPAQIPSRIVPKVMVPPLPGRRGTPQEDNGINSREYEYVTDKMGPDGKIHRSGMDILKSAGRGFLQGAAGNGLFGGLAGAATGAIQGAVDPTGARDANFNTFQRPRLEHEQQLRIQRAAQQQALEKQQQEGEYKQAQTAQIYSNMGKEKDTVLAPGAAVIRDGKLVYQNANRPATPHYVDGTVNGVRGYYDANDPELKGKIQPYDKPPNQGAEYGGLSGVGVFNRKTGEVTTPARDRDKPDTQRTSAINGVQKEHRDLKSAYSAADAAYQVAKKALTQDSNNVEIKKGYDSALAHREATLQKLNSHVQSVGEQFPDEIEAGIGQGGVGYIKPKAGAKPLPKAGSQSAPRATVAPDFVDRVMTELGVDRATALKRIQASGIQVQ